MALLDLYCATLCQHDRHYNYATIRCPSVCLSHVGVVSKRLNASPRNTLSDSNISNHNYV